MRRDRRQAARRLHFTSDLDSVLVLALVLVWGLVSVSEMLRLISCHKPNDKTYFCRLSTKCASPALVLLLLPICVYLWRGQK